MPEGHVYTFDVNEDFMSIAKKNLEKSGMDPYVTQGIYDHAENSSNPGCRSGRDRSW